VNKAKCWNVISGGPSRAYLTEADLIPDSPVVSINRAIDVMERGIRVDFAAFADPPTHLIGAFKLDKYLVPPIQVWVPRAGFYQHNGKLQLHDVVTLWEPHLGASVGIRTMPFGTVPGKGGVQRFLFCLLAALERVMMFRPETVRILCADMMGTWDAGKTEAECEKQQQGAAPAPFRRWEHEKMQLEEMEARANKVGAKFEYRTPAVVTA
jgi:hypothetical protein